MIERQRFRRPGRVQKLPPMNRPPVDNLSRIPARRQRHARDAEEVSLDVQRFPKAASEERPAQKHRAQPERKPARHVHEQEAKEQRHAKDDERLDLGRDELRRRQEGRECSGQHGEHSGPCQVRCWMLGAGCRRPALRFPAQPARGHEGQRVFHHRVEQHRREQRVEESAQHAAQRHPKVKLSQVLRLRSVGGESGVADHRGDEEHDEVQAHHQPRRFAQARTHLVSQRQRADGQRTRE